MKKTTTCSKCGFVQRGEYQLSYCRNVEACKRRVQRAHDRLLAQMCREFAANAKAQATTDACDGTLDAAERRASHPQEFAE